jgi:glucose/mannose-6-phosphate isomerase
MDKLYELVEAFPVKIENSYEMTVPKITGEFNKIAIFGMGGCYILGLVLREFLRDEILVNVCNDYLCLDEKTLVILASYSGSTKEVINVFNKFKKFENILVVASGGKLLEMAERKNVKLIRLPQNIHQRFSFAECFFPILKCLEISGIIKSRKKTVKKIIKSLKKERKQIEYDATTLAIALKDENPLFYASSYFYPAAYRLRTALEEDAKIICHSNKITELFHNELEALPASYFYPVLILDYKELKPFKNRVKFFKKHIKNFYELPFNRYSREERMFLIFYFTDFLGYHLSRLKMTDFGETPLSDKIKRL